MVSIGIFIICIGVFIELTFRIVFLWKKKSNENVTIFCDLMYHRIDKLNPLSNRVEYLKIVRSIEKMMSKCFTLEDYQSLRKIHLLYLEKKKNIESIKQRNNDNYSNERIILNPSYGIGSEERVSGTSIRSRMRPN